MVGGEHGADRAPVPPPALDGVHEPCANSTAPMCRLHPERVDVQTCPAKVAQDLPLGVLGRPLQTGGDISDHPAVDLTDQPDGVVRP